MAVAVAGPVAVWADDDACFGSGADDAAQVEVAFSLNKGTMDDGYNADENEDVAVALEVQFVAVA